MKLLLIANGGGRLASAARHGSPFAAESKRPGLCDAVAAEAPGRSDDDRRRAAAEARKKAAEIRSGRNHHDRPRVRANQAGGFV